MPHQYTPLRHLTSACLAPAQTARLAAAAADPTHASTTAAAIVLLPPEVLQSFEARRWAHVASCILTCSIIGMAYAVGIMSNGLQRIFGLDQTSLTLINGVGSIVGFCAFPAGWLQDRRGPFPVLAIATVSTVVGFLLYANIFTGNIATSVGLLCLINVLSTALATYYDGCCMVTSLFHFTLNRGDMIILQKTFMGLSTTVLSLTYLAFFKPLHDGDDSPTPAPGFAPVNGTSDAFFVSAAETAAQSASGSTGSESGALGIDSPLAHGMVGYCYICALLAGLWTLGCLFGFVEPPQMFHARNTRFGRSFWSPTEPEDSDAEDEEDTVEEPIAGERTALAVGSASGPRHALARYFAESPREESSVFQCLSRTFSDAVAYFFVPRRHHAKQFDVQLLPLGPKPKGEHLVVAEADGGPRAYDPRAVEVFRALIDLAESGATEFIARESRRERRADRRQQHPHPRAYNGGGGQGIGMDVSASESDIQDSGITSVAGHSGIEAGSPSGGLLEEVLNFRNNALTAHSYFEPYGVSFIDGTAPMADDTRTPDAGATATPVVVADIDLIVNRTDLWLSLLTTQEPDPRTLRVAHCFLVWNLGYLLTTSIVSNYLTLKPATSCAIAIVAHVSMWLFFLLPALQTWAFNRSDSLVAVLRVPRRSKEGTTAPPPSIGVSSPHAPSALDGAGDGGLGINASPAPAAGVPPHQQQQQAQSKDVVFPNPIQQAFTTSICHLDIWVFWLSLVGIMCTGMITIQNAEQMYHALGGAGAPKQGGTLVVSLIGVGSALGRIFFGLLESKVLTPRGITATLLLPLPSIVAGITMLLMFVTPLAILWMPFLFIALAYGCSWAVLLLSVRQIFTVDVSQHYLFLFTSGLSAVAVGLGLFGPWYDKISHEQKAAAGKCYGAKCVVAPMLTMAGLCFFGAVFAVLFHLRWVRRNGLTWYGRMQQPQQVQQLTQ